MKTKKRIITIIEILLVPVIVIVSITMVNTPKDHMWQGTAVEKISYSNVSESDYMDIYLPDSENPCPLIIIVHGGGFFSNDSQSTEAEYMYNYFRSKGYACASINYRLSGEAVFPAAVSDIKAAIRFLHANASIYNLDETRFAIWGESAGAYLATMAAVTGEDEFKDVSFHGEDETEETSSEVYALIDFYGPMEFHTMDEQFNQLGIPDVLRKITGVSENGLTGDCDSPESLFVGKTITQLSDEEKEMISPFTYVRKNLNGNSNLKVYIRHGKMDITVPYLQSKDLAEELSQALGSEAVDFDLFTSYKHADARFYLDKNLDNVVTFLNQTTSSK